MEDPAERSARLKRLREEQQGQAAAAGGGAGEQQGAEDAGARSKRGVGGAPPAAPAMQFRNYKPRDERIDSTHVEAPKPRQLDAPAVDEAAAAEPLAAIDAYAPKKPHLDLKRDLAGKLQKLDYLTAVAVDELLDELQHERLEAEGGGDDEDA